MNQTLKTVLIWIRNSTVSISLAILCCFGALGFYVMLFGPPENVEYVYAFLFMVGVPIILAALDSKELYKIKFRREPEEEQRVVSPLDPDTAALMLVAGIHCMTPDSMRVKGATVNADKVIAMSQDLQNLQNHFAIACDSAGLPLPERMQYLDGATATLADILLLVHKYLEYREQQTEDIIDLIGPEEESEPG